MSEPIYQARHPARSEFLELRGLTYHLNCWGERSLVSAGNPPLVMLHGWMDVGASFQFLVDEMHALGAADRFIIAPDWRGFGLSYERSRAHAQARTSTPTPMQAPTRSGETRDGHWPRLTDTYWFPDYLADLETMLAQLFGPDLSPIDLLGHSMGGNVAMLYAGVRPERIRRLINLEGFGMPSQAASRAPARYARWLDELAAPAELRSYDDLAAVARRLQRNNPLLPPERALWLAGHWASPNAEGRWELRADPVHKQIAPTLYRADEVVAIWQQIRAPLLWAEGDRSNIGKLLGPAYPREEFEQRLSVVPDVERHVASPAGHMLHHDQPGQIARWLGDFLSASSRST